MHRFGSSNMVYGRGKKKTFLYPALAWSDLICLALRSAGPKASKTRYEATQLENMTTYQIYTIWSGFSCTLLHKIQEPPPKKKQGKWNTGPARTSRFSRCMKSGTCAFSVNTNFWSIMCIHKVRLKDLRKALCHYTAMLINQFQRFFYKCLHTWSWAKTLPCPTMICYVVRFSGSKAPLVIK